MMTNSLFSGWDSYTRKALWGPAGVAAMPVFMLAFHFTSALGWYSALPALLSLGVAAALVEWVRPHGRRTEKRLVQAWGGMPTTRALRYHDGTSPGLRDNRRRQVESISEHTLPSELEEAADPRVADHRYSVAVHAAIAQVRSDGVDSTRLNSENASYGFRRNARALKWIAIVVLLAASIANLWLAEGADSWLVGWLTLGVDGLAALFWLFVVTDRWVTEQAETFSDRFFITVDATVVRARRT